MKAKSYLLDSVNGRLDFIDSASSAVSGLCSQCHETKSHRHPGLATSVLAKCARREDLQLPSVRWIMVEQFIPGTTKTVHSLESAYHAT